MESQLNWDQNLVSDLRELYGTVIADEFAQSLRELVAQYRLSRSEDLNRRDRATAASWYLDSANAVYILYADRFNSDALETKTSLQALRESLPYFEELGVDVLHVLPILANNGDAGFAVTDYREIHHSYGTNQQFIELVTSAHARGQWIAFDLVLNHVGDEHDWAERAKAGRREYIDYFIWDESNSGESWPEVPDIFPEIARGHWDYVPELDKWVWATFYKRWPQGTSYPGTPKNSCGQWDLNYSNPQVLREMAENLLFLANWGIDIFRLDAVPFLWKERGTACTSRPQVYAIIRVLRAVLAGVAPRSVLLAEANQDPDQLVAYFDRGAGVQMAYQFTLMPALWQAAVDGNDDAVNRTLEGMPRMEAPTPGLGGTARTLHWWIFSECHDEVSLEALDVETAARLWAFFRRDAKVLKFRCADESEDAPPGGISGTTYSLLHGDEAKIARLWELKISLASDPRCIGIPVFFMGEELGVECRELTELPREERGDTRNVKRVRLTEEIKQRRFEPGTKEHRLFNGLKQLLARRAAQRKSNGRQA